MKIMVQHIESRLYMTRDGTWVKVQGAEFQNAIDAISFCIKRSLRAIRLVVNAGLKDEERYLYPFGEDPAIKAEKKKIRRAIAESRRLKQQKRVLLAHLDSVRAEAKELKKQVPFQRKPISGEL